MVHFFKGAFKLTAIKLLEFDKQLQKVTVSLLSSLPLVVGSSYHCIYANIVILSYIIKFNSHKILQLCKLLQIAISVNAP